MGENENNKKPNKRKKRGGFLGFLLVAFVLIVIVNVTLSYGSRLETTIVRNGSEEDLISADGYIFRDQTVIYAPTDGYIYCEVAEDERVSSGQVVMYIYKNQINLSVSNELKKIESEIAELSEGLRTADVFSSDTAKIEQSISQLLRGVPKLGIRGNTQRAYEIKEDVNSLIEKRRIITGEVTAPNREQELAALKSKKAELEKEHNIERTLIHAPRTGAFTARIDGMEEKLALSALDGINNDYFKELGKMSEAKPSSEKAVKDQPIAKIVNNFLWSVAAQVPAKEVEGLGVGDVLSIRLPDLDTDTVLGTVSKITPEDAGKVILVVSTNKYVDTVYSLSKAKVELVKNSFGGFRIPAKSLRVMDGKMGVYVVRNDKAHFIPVELSYNGKEWVVVKEKTESAENPIVLKLYDELIVNGHNIYDGKVVR